MIKISPETHNLYLELMQQLTVFEANRSISSLNGCFTKKKINGELYYYFQYSDPGNLMRQTYLGKKSKELEKLVKEFKKTKKLIKPDIDCIKKLCAQLRVGGAIVSDAPSARIIKSLSDGGIFKLNGILIGTHAFSVIGNMIGANWKTHLKTQDIDIAAPKNIDIVMGDLKADVPNALEQLKMGFLPVPSLNPKNPSTSFKVRGSTLMVDILTAGKKESEKPVFLSKFNTAAQPLHYLDYLIKDFEKGAIINSEGILVNVPNPARFALHKIIISQDRPAFAHGKTMKDISQAAKLLDILSEERPGDILVAWDDLKGRGKNWVKKFKAGLKVLENKHQMEFQKFLSVLPELKK